MELFMGQQSHELRWLRLEHEGLREEVKALRRCLHGCGAVTEASYDAELARLRQSEKEDHLASAGKTRGVLDVSPPKAAQRLRAGDAQTELDAASAVCKEFLKADHPVARWSPSKVPTKPESCSSADASFSTIAETTGDMSQTGSCVLESSFSFSRSNSPLPARPQRMSSPGPPRAGHAAAEMALVHEEERGWLAIEEVCSKLVDQVASKRQPREHSQQTLSSEAQLLQQATRKLQASVARDIASKPSFTAPGGIPGVSVARDIASKPSFTAPGGIPTTSSSGPTTSALRDSPDVHTGSLGALRCLTASLSIANGGAVAEHRVQDLADVKLRIYRASFAAKLNETSTTPTS